MSPLHFALTRGRNLKFRDLLSEEQLLDSLCQAIENLLNTCKKKLLKFNIYIFLFDEITLNFLTSYTTIKLCLEESNDLTAVFWSLYYQAGKYV
jgi:hypothetical protein